MQPDPEIDLDVLSEPPPGLTARLESALGWFEGLRSRPEVVAFATVFTIGFVALAGFASTRSAAVDIADRVPEIRLETTLPVASAQANPMIHVTGAVVNPGVYSLEPGSRIIDALEAAGGPLPEGLVHELNLAAHVADGMQIRVPVEGETVAPIDTGGDGGLPVDVNYARASELEEIVGIGPSLAAAIISYRDNNGPFATVEDLLAVPGIGPAKLESLRDQVRLR